MFMTKTIRSAIELPYPLIEISTIDEHFVFQFDRFDDDQTDFSIKAGGVTGSYSVIYQCRGIESHFECDITTGNVYDFYVSLRDAYNAVSAQDAVAVLKDYGNTASRTGLTVRFDRKGHCRFEGSFRNKYTQFKSGIELTFEADQSYIPDILRSLEVFFDELRTIQGHGSFY